MQAALSFSFRRWVTTLAVLLGALVFSLWLGVRWGDQPVSVERAWRDPTSFDAVILWSLRTPRVILAMLVGAALSASGAALQALTRNPLADPFVLGVSGGAALGATLAFALNLGWMGPALLAFAGALGATVLVFVVGGGRRSSSTTVLLTGVIVNAVASAWVTGIKALSSPDKVGDILHWLAGALGYESTRTLLLAFALQALALGSLCLLAGRLNLLSLGDEEAASLGVDVPATRRWVLVWASLSVAAAVSLSGLVGFVGLLVPQLLRRLLGPDQRLLIPAAAVGGAFFLVLADLGARLLFQALQTEPPVGVVTALIGGPVFLWLLHQSPER